MQYTITRNSPFDIDRASLQPRAVASMTDALLAISEIMNAYGTIVENISQQLEVANGRIEVNKKRLLDVAKQSQLVRRNLTQSVPNGFTLPQKGSFRKSPPRFVTLGKRPKQMTEACEKLQKLPDFKKLEKFRDCLVSDRKDYSTLYSDPSFFVRQKYEAMREEYTEAAKRRKERKKLKMRAEDRPVNPGAVKKMKVKNEFGEDVIYERPAMQTTPVPDKKSAASEQRTTGHSIDVNETFRIQPDSPQSPTTTSISPDLPIVDDGIQTDWQTSISIEQATVALDSDPCPSGVDNKPPPFVPPQFTPTAVDADLRVDMDWQDCADTFSEKDEVSEIPEPTFAELQAENPQPHYYVAEDDFGTGNPNILELDFLAEIRRNAGMLKPLEAQEAKRKKKKKKRAILPKIPDSENIWDLLAKRRRAISESSEEGLSFSDSEDETSKCTTKCAHQQNKNSVAVCVKDP